MFLAFVVWYFLVWPVHLNSVHVFIFFISSSMESFRFIGCPYLLSSFLNERRFYLIKRKGVHLNIAQNRIILQRLGNMVLCFLGNVTEAKPLYHFTVHMKSLTTNSSSQEMN